MNRPWPRAPTSTCRPTTRRASSLRPGGVTESTNATKFMALGALGVELGQDRFRVGAEAGYSVIPSSLEGQVAVHASRLWAHGDDQPTGCGKGFQGFYRAMGQ